MIVAAVPVHGHEHEKCLLALGSKIYNYRDRTRTRSFSLYYQTNDSERACMLDCMSCAYILKICRHSSFPESLAMQSIQIFWRFDVSPRTAQRAVLGTALNSALSLDLSAPCVGVAHPAEANLPRA